MDLTLTLLDPDFDDDWQPLALISHEIETTGTVSLHPNENRIDYDPVPLFGCARNEESRPAAVREELIRHWIELRRIEQERERWWQEQATQPREPDEPSHAEQVVQQARRWVPPQRRVPEAEGELEALLRNMRLDDPILAANGRVWRGHIALNESDVDNVPMERMTWVEVWRGRGVVIFRMGGVWWPT